MFKTGPEKAPDILIVNDEELLHRFYKKIQEGLNSQGHDIKLHWLEDYDDLHAYLKKFEKSPDNLPRMILLDVCEVGAPAAIWLAHWFKTHHPDHPLPPISFLSLDNTMAMTEAMRVRRDTEIAAEVVSVDERAERRRALVQRMGVPSAMVVSHVRPRSGSLILSVGSLLPKKGHDVWPLI